MQPERRPELLVRVDRLRKSFGGRTAVDEVSLELRPGEVLGFVGPNGAGKTTTLRMLAGLLAPDAGEGEVFGRDLRKAGRGDPSVGYMPQKLALYGDLTVTDNLRFRADMYRLAKPGDHVERALAEFGLADRRRQRAGDLSGGWARRLQLAAALIHDPPVVLLDEPTAGLDSQSRHDVWARIEALAARGAGVIVNTHDLSEAERCTRVALFRLGRIVLEGRPAELEAAAPIRAALVDLSGTSLRLEAGGELLIVEPHGRRLRVLARAERFDAFRSRAEAAGAVVTPDEVRLADIALLNERDASPLEAAA